MFLTRNSTTLWPDETTRFVVCNEIWAVRSGCEILGGWPRVVHSSSNPEGTPFLVPKLAMEIMGMMGSAVGSMVMLWWAIVGGFACGSDECKGLILRIWSFLTIIAPSQSWGCHGVSSCHIFWGFFRGVTLRVCVSIGGVRILRVIYYVRIDYTTYHVLPDRWFLFLPCDVIFMPCTLQLLTSLIW